MKVQLSDHFTYRKLLRFTLPSIIMMVFISIYSVVDGFFVSNYAGKTALAAVNLGFPFLMMLASGGFMIGSGGSALVAKTMGEGDTERAQRIFSLFIYFAIGLGCLLTLVGYLSIPGILRMTGAEGDLFDQSLTYAHILLVALPFFTVQQACQSFFIAAGRPQTGLAVTIAAGVTNMFLDYLFVAVFNGGLIGAGWATAFSQILGGLASLIYFLCPNKSSLRLGRGPWNGKALVQGCTNGLSELVSNISGSVVSMLFNAQLIRFIGEIGVAAYSVLMYVNFVFLAIFIGYSVGTNPVFAFAYGAGKKDELKSLLKKSLIIVAICATAMTVLAEVAGNSISVTFVGYDADLLDLTNRGFDIYSFSFLFAGFGILGSAFFTGLNNGIVSAIISISRTLVFQVGCVLILPHFLGVDGIWLSVVVAEILSCAVTFLLLLKFRKRYGY